MHSQDTRYPITRPRTRGATRKNLWRLAVWLLLLAIVAGPAAAAPLYQDPTPPPGDPEAGFVEFEALNGQAGEFVEAPAAPAVMAPALMAAQAIPAGDLPSYDVEAVSLLNVDNSMETVRHLSVDIGPRLSGTPQEGEGAAYLGAQLESYNYYDVTYPTFGTPSTRNVARVTSPNAALPGGPNWQMNSSANARVTGDTDAVQAEVIYAGSGQSDGDFPPETNGKIVMLDYARDSAIRNTAVVNAVSHGAAGVILYQTGDNASPPSQMSLSTAQPMVPVVGGGRAHGDWIKGLLAQGPLTLRIATNRYTDILGVNVIAVRRAADDPAGAAPIIMIGAHHDSVLGGPGADDNLSGTGVYLEIARVLSKYTFDKEVRIGGYGNEEGGLRGSRAYVNSLTAEEKARFLGSWVMDMVATTNPPATLWVHTYDGASNYVVQSAYDAAARIGLTGLQNCKISGSDHQPFTQAGMPSAVFSFMQYWPSTEGCLVGGRDQLEPQYHKPNDTLAENISRERLEIMLKLVGSAVFHSALNAVTLTETPEGSTVEADCGDGGTRYFGLTNSTGSLVAGVPHATCDFKATAPGGTISHVDDVKVHGDLTVAFPPVFEPSVSPDPVLLNGNATASPNVSFAGVDATASCDAVDTSSVGPKSVNCTVVDGAGTYTQAAAYHVIYAFSSFMPPVDNPPAMNGGNSGQAIPLKWQITDANGVPVTNLKSVKVTASDLSCSLDGTGDQIEEYASGKSGFRSLGTGNYQFNWKTPTSYAGSCKTMMLDLGEGPGMERTALFEFAK